jgi:SAM-dependent methyltransferase
MRKLFGFALAIAAIAAINLTPIGADDKDKKKDQPKEKLKTEIEVPYVPTAKAVVTGMLKIANVKEGETVYDLGCGDGRIVITAVKDFKAKRGLGVDFNPERLEDCKKAMEAAKLTDDQKKSLTFKHGDVLKMTAADFKDVDVVTLYLLPEVNKRLKPVLKEGLKNGARVVSHDFDMGDDWLPEKKEEINATDDAGFTRDHRVYLWTIKK